MKLFRPKMKVNTCTACEIGLFTKNWGFGNFTYVIVTVYFTAFESVIVSRNTRRPCYVVESSEPLHLLSLMGVSRHPYTESLPTL